jgi:hypothetical protein
MVAANSVAILREFEPEVFRQFTQHLLGCLQGQRFLPSIASCSSLGSAAAHSSGYQTIFLRRRRPVVQLITHCHLVSWSGMSGSSAVPHLRNVVFRHMHSSYHFIFTMLSVWVLMCLLNQLKSGVKVVPLETVRTSKPLIFCTE